MARFNKKTKIAALTAALVVGATGTAYAYWTMSGAGSATATTGTTQAVTVNQTGTPITGLYPGGPAKALSGNFDNPNAANVTVKAVTASVASTNVPTCQAAWYVVEGTDSVSTHILIAGNGVGTWTGLTVKMLDDAANQDVCKGAIITITYALAA